MTTFLVQKTVYISTQVQASTWMEAMQKANDIHYCAWKYDDEETPCVVALQEVDNLSK